MVEKACHHYNAVHLCDQDEKDLLMALGQKTTWAFCKVSFERYAKSVAI